MNNNNFITNEHKRDVRFRKTANEAMKKAQELPEKCVNSQVAAVAISSDEDPVIKQYGSPSVDAVFNRYNGYVVREDNPVALMTNALGNMNVGETSANGLNELEASTVQALANVRQERQRRNI